MRRVVKSDQRPLEIKPQQESVWICMCGLSKNQPFCDGSHKTTRDEEDGKTYEYDAEGHRREVWGALLSAIANPALSKLWRSASQN